MNKTLYRVIFIIVVIFAGGWLAERQLGHRSGKDLIMLTTSGAEWASTKAELSYIAAHTKDSIFSNTDSNGSLRSLRKVAIDAYTIDSEQIRESKDYSVNLFTSKTRSLNVQLLSEPVLIIKEKRDTSSL